MSCTIHSLFISYYLFTIYFTLGKKTSDWAQWERMNKKRKPSREYCLKYDKMLPKREIKNKGIIIWRRRDRVKSKY
jgi:hypothetical protein